jgi:lysophospholipase L1-like esterase
LLRPEFIGKMIDKIYAYGDSFTAGDGIASKDAWPAKLSELMKTPVINRGVPGGSNKLSIINLLNDFADIEHPDRALVVFSWTGISRTAVYHPERKEWGNILLGHDPWDPYLKKMKDTWYEYVYNDYEGLMEYYMQQIFVASFLEARKVQYAFINSFLEGYIDKGPFEDQYKNMVKLLPTKKFVLGHDTSIHEVYCINKGMLCNDGYHPNEEAHAELAKKIKLFLRDIRLI